MMDRQQIENKLKPEVGEQVDKLIATIKDTWKLPVERPG